jgi:lysophospholipase L1-like esterase
MLPGAAGLEGKPGWSGGGLVAHRLAMEAGAGFRYANLAVRGRLFGRVVDEQVPGAVAMRPDLVSFAAGGNDGNVMLARCAAVSTVSTCLLHTILPKRCSRTRTPSVS